MLLLKGDQEKIQAYSLWERKRIMKARLGETSQPFLIRINKNEIPEFLPPMSNGGKAQVEHLTKTMKDFKNLVIFIEIFYFLVENS